MATRKPLVLAGGQPQQLQPADNLSLALADLVTRARPGDNRLCNGSFALAQRQTPGTATTITSDRYGPDRWRCCSQGGALQFHRVDSAPAAETGMQSRYYGFWAQTASAAKCLLAQPLEQHDWLPLAGRSILFQVKLRADVNRTVKIGFAHLTSLGTVDVLPASLVSSWNANTSDPTLGTNLAWDAPTQSCAVTNLWQQFSVTITAPNAGNRNLVAVLWTDSQLPINGWIAAAEAGLFDGDQVRDWLPPPPAAELAMCQRYYEKSWGVDTAPGTTWSVGTAHVKHLSSTSGGNILSVPFAWKAYKRSAPTLTLYDHLGSSGKLAAFISGMGWTGANAPSGSFATETVGCAEYTLTNLLGLNFGFTAESEL